MTEILACGPSYPYIYKWEEQLNSSALESALYDVDLLLVQGKNNFKNGAYTQ